MPDHTEGLSPLQAAMRHFWSMRSARLGLAVIGSMMLLALYAPFIANETALFWSDEQGLSFPALEELFNRNRYKNRHDLLF